MAVWLCLKMGSENMVLVRLLQIGAKDLTVGMATLSVWDGIILCVGLQHSLCGMSTFYVWDGNILCVG